MNKALRNNSYDAGIQNVRNKVLSNDLYDAGYKTIMNKAVLRDGSCSAWCKPIINIK